MKLGILSDTHNQLERTQRAVRLLADEGAQALVHCGDLATADIVAACAILPAWFVFGNHDADSVPELEQAAKQHGVTCLGWGGEIELAGKRIAISHGHLAREMRPLRAARPDYLLSGHSHAAIAWNDDGIRCINPGALHRANPWTVALLDLSTDQLKELEVTR